MDNCSEIAKFTLMVENPLFKYRFFACLLISTLFCLLVPSSSKILYVIIFNIVGILSYYGIEIYTTKTIEQDKLTELIDRCNTEKNVKKENYITKLKDLMSEDVEKKPISVLNEEQQKDFEERGSISLESVKNNEKNKESFENSYNIDNSTNDFQNIISSKSFKNIPAVFESTYEMIQSPPLPNPPSQVNKDGCLLSKDMCNPICSGNNENPCNLQTPSPGPQWQPQSASTVQDRLNNGKFVPNFCTI